MKTALLIVDIQNDYFPGGKMALEGTMEASENAAVLLSTFRRRQLPVVHIQHIAKQADATFFLPDTEGVKIHKSVTPLSNEAVIIKNYPNSFRQTALLEYLKEHQIVKLVIAGMMTHMCIDSTTRAAFDFEFKIQLAHDACATKALSFGGVDTPASHVQNAYIAGLNGSFAQALSTQEIIADLG
ncbi:MAG: cysteine hydrolase [Glaciimonas sp.]|nr:cysteine hydrolase [Glaciimonas sp.]